MTILFDTSIVIDVLRADPDALDYVRGVTTVPRCSEVARGLRRAERTSPERLFQAIRWIPVDEPIAACGLRTDDAGGRTRLGA